MGKLYCTNGHTYTTREFHRAPDETHCTEPGCHARLQTGMERNAQKKRTGGGLWNPNETPAQKAAREEFNRLVCEWPCWGRKHRSCSTCAGIGFRVATGEMCGTCNGDGAHHCQGRKDAHHLIPKSWIQETFSDLPEDELLAIKYAPIIGCPACRYGLHEPLESRADVIYFEELDPELPEFCERVDDRYSKPGRPSILERLKVESPQGEAVS